MSRFLTKNGKRIQTVSSVMLFGSFLRYQEIELPDRHNQQKAGRIVASEGKHMKKRLGRWMALLLVGVILFAFPACGKQETETESGAVVGAPDSEKTYQSTDGRLYYLSRDLSRYITISAYTGLSVSVDESAVNESVEESLRELAKTYATLSSAKTVALNDVVFCSFTGYVDSKEFVKATNEQIEVVENGYEKIPGFAEGLVGAVPGNTKRVTVTLPEDYSDPDVAGKQATIDVVIGYVVTPTLTDDNVKAHTSGAYKSVSAYRKYLREETYRNMAVQALIDKIRESATFPDTLTAASEQCYKDLVNMITANTGMTYENYLKANGMTDADIRDMAKESYEYNLVMYRLVQLTGMQVYEGDYYPRFEEFVNAYLYQQEAAGVTITREEAEKYVNENRELVISACLENKVFDYLIANNKVTKK